MDCSEMIYNWINPSYFFQVNHILFDLISDTEKISMIAFKTVFMWEVNYKQLKCLPYIS